MTSVVGLVLTFQLDGLADGVGTEFFLSCMYISNKHNFCVAMLGKGRHCSHTAIMFSIRSSFLSGQPGSSPIPKLCKIM